MKDSENKLQWYPMGITYHRELTIKEHLDSLGIQNFLPMRHELVETKDGKKLMFVPAIHNLIFVYSTQKKLTELKMTKKEFEPMRYIMKFIRVASAEENSVQYLDYDNYLRKVGKQVRIMEGNFAGVEGVIKRIKKNKYVVVQIEGVAAVAITYIPAHYLTEI